MSASKSKLVRARAKLERKLAGGWQRAVFASPQRDDGSRDERVLAGPGSLSEGAPDYAERFAEQFAALFAAAEDAAAAGLFKQTVVLDERERVELDARHGHVKGRTLDEQTVAKVMGGKDRALRPDRSGRLLRAIGIMNADGSISARNAKKYKQVNHLVELCRPLWTERTRDGAGDGDGRAQNQAGAAQERPLEPLRIVDLACGNSYLSFVVLEALALEHRPARLLGVDRRDDVIATSRARALEIGLGDEATFLAAALEQLDPARLRSELGGTPDLAISLHACDTATDAALALAIAAGVDAILCVPCCQAELARQLTELSSAARERSPLAAMPAALDHGLLRRTLAEVLTDGIRVELLEACGYAVTTLEFVASTHTPKNLLLRASRTRRRGPKQWRLDPVAARCEQLGVDPALLRALTHLQQAARASEQPS